jgi:hypothetical protein
MTIAMAVRIADQFDVIRSHINGEIRLGNAQPPSPKRLTAPHRRG